MQPTTLDSRCGKVRLRLKWTGEGDLNRGATSDQGPRFRAAWLVPDCGERGQVQHASNLEGPALHAPSAFAAARAWAALSSLISFPRNGKTVSARPGRAAWQGLHFALDNYYLVICRALGDVANDQC